jgi:hypothetical protein
MDAVVVRLQALLNELCPEVADYDKVPLHAHVTTITRHAHSHKLGICVPAQTVVHSEANGEDKQAEGILSAIASSSRSSTLSAASGERPVPVAATSGLSISHPGVTRYQPAAGATSANPLSRSSPPAPSTTATASSTVLSPRSQSAASSAQATFDPAAVPEAASAHFPYYALHNPVAFFPRLNPLSSSSSSSSSSSASTSDASSSTPLSSPSSSSSSPSSAATPPMMLSSYPYFSSPYPFPFPMPSPYLPPFPPPFPADTHSHALALAKDDPLHWPNDRYAHAHTRTHTHASLSPS